MGILSRARAAKDNEVEHDRNREGFVTIVKASAHNPFLAKVSRYLKDGFGLHTHFGSPSRRAS